MQYKDAFVTLCLDDGSELQEEINKMRMWIIKKKRKKQIAICNKDSKENACCGMQMREWREKSNENSYQGNCKQKTRKQKKIFNCGRIISHWIHFLISIGRRELFRGNLHELSSHLFLLWLYCNICRIYRLHYANNSERIWYNKYSSRRILKKILAGKFCKFGERDARRKIVRVSRGSQTPCSLLDKFHNLRDPECQLAKMWKISALGRAL